MCSYNVLLLTEPHMWDLVRIVVPKVAAEWKDLAYIMRYDILIVSAISKDSFDVHDRCTKLFENWLSTNNGIKPKTYRTLLRCIKQVMNLVAASEEIEMKLINGKEVAT